MLEYKRLSQLIRENSGVLYEKLCCCSLPNDAELVKQMCLDYVGNLTGKNTEYMNQLSLLEQDLLSPVLKIIDTLYSTEMELSQNTTTSSLKNKNEEQNIVYDSSPKRIVKEYTPALAGATGGTLLAMICKPDSWGIVLFGSVISTIISKILYSAYVEKNENPNDENCDVNTCFPEYKLTSEDVAHIIGGLENAGECIDKVLLTYRRHIDIVQAEYMRKMDSFNLDKKYIGVLECFQLVLGNMNSMELSPIVKDTIKQVNNSLAVQGYKAVHYTDEFEKLFDVKRDDIAEIEEFKPAIVKVDKEKDSLIIKGEVVIPN